jgi:hypothetical protein
MSDTWEPFQRATRVLVGPGPIKQRLIEAYRGSLAELRDAEVPDCIVGDFAALNAAMHCAHAAGGLSAPEVAVRKMSEKDAADHAAAILEMFTTLAAQAERESGTARRLRIVGEQRDEDGVPAFLSRA